jgi:hypothetical protein
VINRVSDQFFFGITQSCNVTIHSSNIDWVLFSRVFVCFFIVDYVSMNFKCSIALDNNVKKQTKRMLRLMNLTRRRRPTMTWMKHTRYNSSSSTARSTYTRSVPRTNSLGGVWDVSAPDQKFGFVGVGYLAASVIEGLCSSPDQVMAKIVVSPRSATHSSSLQRRFPTLIEVAENNAEVTRDADVVFLGVLPAQVPDVLAELKGNMKKSATLVSFVSSVSRRDVAALAGIDRDMVVKAIPVPTSRFGYDTNSST